CPAELGRGIAITGSVARGASDQFSDIELNFWVEEHQGLEAYRNWLSSQGAQVAIQPRRECHSGLALMTKSWYKGVFLEAVWHPWSALERLLVPVLGAKTTDHWELTRAWHVADAVILRDDGRLSNWQERLKHYPDALQAKLIAQATWSWS